MMRQRVGSTITALLLAVIGLVLPAAPAQAAGSISAGPYTLYDGCRDYPYQVEGSNLSASEWDLDVTLYAPSGDESSYDFDYGSGSSLSQTGSFNVCAYEGAGNYSIEATITWSDDDFNEVGVDNLRGTLQMSRQRTTSALSVSDTTPKYKSVVRFKMRSKQETPNGWANNANEYVALEVKCGSSGWGRVPGSKALTDAYGKAVLRYRWDIRRTCSFRMLTLPTVNSAISRSTGVKINPQ